MRRLILSDVHGHLPALRAVLDTATRVDEIWCLGDVVGLGPWPDECVATLRDAAAILVMGNHDVAAVGRPGPEFDRVPLLGESNPWTRSLLSEEQRGWLDRVPARLSRDGITLVHDIAALRRDGPTAPLPVAEDLARTVGGPTLVGHFHLPHDVHAAVPDDADIVARVPRPGPVAGVDTSTRILNPGAVGVPDAHPGYASFAIAEDGALAFHLVPVDLEAGYAMSRARGAGPLVLAQTARQVADAAIASGDLARGRQLLREAAPALSVSGSRRQDGLSLIAIAAIAAAEEDVESALDLLAAVSTGLTDHPLHRYRASIALAHLRGMVLDIDARVAGARVAGLDRASEIARRILG